jgi:hypothetical protein
MIDIKMALYVIIIITMELDTLFDIFALNKGSDPRDLTENVHKPYMAYRKFINPDARFVRDVLMDLQSLTLKFKDKYSPCTTRNYLRHMLASLEMEFIRDVVTEEEKTSLKELLRQYIHDADQVCNRAANINPLNNNVENDVECELPYSDILPLQNLINLSTEQLSSNNDESNDESSKYAQTQTSPCTECQSNIIQMLKEQNDKLWDILRLAVTRS